ncbi:unnamed protein product [Auanema sp. JU1783]|nr:unnamed protein product [Auanema sp. JU1783]
MSGERSNLEVLAKEAGVTPHVAIYGGGSMAKCISEGALNTEFISKHQISISTKSTASAMGWTNNGYQNVYTDVNEQSRTHSEGIAIIGVKPQARNSLWSSKVDFSKYNAIVSLMAGITTETLENEISEFCPNPPPIIRIFPNSPCAVGKGTTLICNNKKVSEKTFKLVKALVETFSTVHIIDENQINAAGALTASSPAWTYMYIESLADGGVLSGLPRSEAMKYAAEAVIGAAQMVLARGCKNPGSLKDEVCSPAGTTIAGVRQLEKTCFRSGVMEAVKAATDRAKEL